MSSDPAKLLREHGLQVTAQRLVILRGASRRSHCTADDVAEKVRAEIGAISRQTVYDTLGMLAKKSIIRRIQSADSPARYENRVGDNHHHLICRTCGKTVDVDCAIGDAPCLAAAEAGKYPTVDLVDDHDVFTAGDFGNDSFFIGVVARLTRFDGSRTSSEVRQAEARLRELLAREQRLAQDIELAVRRAYLQLSDARERLEGSRRAVTRAEASLRAVEVRYKGQTATIPQLIDAQVALSNARVRRTGAQAEVEVARAALEQAIGRLTDLMRR